MLKSLIGALLLGAATVAGFAIQAQAGYQQCAMPITRGGCSSPLPQPLPLTNHPKST
jgi:hypothetical protein